MINLPVDVTTPQWNAVKAYVALRSAELIDVATSVTVSDTERRDAAMRLDELRLLLAAPGETVEAARAAHAGAEQSMRTY